MPLNFDPVDSMIWNLEDCIDALDRQGFDPADDLSLQRGALMLRRLANNRQFLGDLVLAELKDRCERQCHSNNYSGQVLMLYQPKANYFMRANIWPARDEAAVRESGEGAFLYGLPHDHNFDFLTVGYHGPGYWSDYYEYDHHSVVGQVGEQIALTFIERSRLEAGKVMLYRAHCDIHRQLPPDALSVSINIMHVTQQQRWMDQYRFDLENDTISGIISHNANAVLLGLAVLTGTGNGIDLAESFAASHNSERMRWESVQALAQAETDSVAQYRIYDRFSGSTSALVRAECAKRLGIFSTN